MKIESSNKPTLHALPSNIAYCETSDGGIGICISPHFANVASKPDNIPETLAIEEFIRTVSEIFTPSGITKVDYGVREWGITVNMTHVNNPDFKDAIKDLLL